MPIHPSGFWMPEISVAQAKIFNCYKRYVLASGPRKSSKTYGNLHRLTRHAWETDRGSIAIFSKNIKVAKEGGVWADLTDIIWPEWFKSGIGIEYGKVGKNYAPGQDGQTRTLYCKLKNRHGNYTKVYLNSLDFDGDVENALKERRFSMIYFAELSKFKTRKVFDTAIMSLRIPHLRYEDHMFLADTNPADEGENSWIYKLWYEERIREMHEDPEFQKDLELVEIMLHENPYLSERERKDVIAAHRHDPDLYARYVDGKWTASNKDSFFVDTYREERHTIGDATKADEVDWEILLPPEKTTTLYTGWDIGDINHAAHIAYKAQDEKGDNHYGVLDEQVVIGERIKLADFVEGFMELMRKWQDFLGTPIIWRHWSDNSSWKYSAAAESTEELIVRRVSGGLIRLGAAPKFNGSVKKRVDLTKIILFENRLIVSAHCIRTRQMFKGLRPGGGKLKYIADNEHKHSFDSLTNIIIAEEPVDLARYQPQAGKIEKEIIELG